jgi:hypothetical protein
VAFLGQMLPKVLCAGARRLRRADRRQLRQRLLLTNRQLLAHADTNAHSKASGHAVAQRIHETPWGARMVLAAQTGWGHEPALPPLDFSVYSTEGGH